MEQNAEYVLNKYGFTIEYEPCNGYYNLYRKDENDAVDQLYSRLFRLDREAAAKIFLERAKALIYE